MQTGSGEVGSPQRLWTRGPRYRVWNECYFGACGGVTPVAGAGKGPHPGARGLVSPGSGSGRGVTPQTVDMGSQAHGLGVVTLEMWACEPWGRVGRRSLWRLWSCVPRCTVWEVGSPWRLWV